MLCSFEGCPHQAEMGRRLCVYHLPVDQKGMEAETFNDRVKQLSGGPLWGQFKGFKFPATIEFNRVPFGENSTFEDTEFGGRVLFASQMLRHGCTMAGAKFKGGLHLQGTIDGELNLRDVEISGCFDGGKYGQCVLLCAETVFNGSVFFTGARIEGGNIIFDRAQFNGQKAEFKKAKLNGQRITFFESVFAAGKTNFDATRFAGDVAFFLGAKFTKGWASFYGTRWRSTRTTFDGAKFAGEVTSFGRSLFAGAEVSFKDCDFGARTSDFTGMRSLADNLSFTKCRFESELVSFDRARLGIGPVEIAHSRVSGRLSFRGTQLTGKITINDVHFSDTSSLFVTDLSFAKPPQSVPTILFTHVQFRPFSTFFERISPEPRFSRMPASQRPLLVFRYCNLRDVYFSDNDMSLFSFFRSAFFEESFLTSSRWQPMRERIFRWMTWPMYWRRYQICEDLLFKHLAGKRSVEGSKQQEPEAGHFDFPSHHFEVAELYVRMKSAADKAKDYHLASWFYFNEFEMKRRELCDRAFAGRRAWLGFFKALFSYRLLLYNGYKACAGYGEKPLWSALWAVLFTVFFSLLHLLNGLRIQSTGQVINYDWGSTSAGSILSGQFLQDFGVAVMFTLSRTLPTSYLPGLKVDISCQTNGFLDFSLSAANTLILVTMIVFIAVGLKRHFRRF